MRIEPSLLSDTVKRIKRRWRTAICFASAQAILGSLIFGFGADRSRYSDTAIAITILVNLLVCSLYAYQWTKHTRRALVSIEAEQSRLFRLQALTGRGDAS
jgi:sugar phosphate permease